jgi:hypothetical protein
MRPELLDPCLDHHQRDRLAMRPRVLRAGDRVPNGALWERRGKCVGHCVSVADELIREKPEQQLRRAWVERQEKFKDRTEEFDHEIAAAATSEERQALSDALGAYRTAHRQEDIQSGRRAPLMIRQCMWREWIAIAVSHELTARSKAGSPDNPSSSQSLGEEFHASLVAIAASAHTIEALFGELKYLIRVQRRTDKQYQAVRNTFAVAFGWDNRKKDRLSPRLQELFQRRDFAVHPYTDLAPVVPHPSGVLSSAELAHFNAVTSGVAVDCALDVLAEAANPPKPCNRWVERWAEEHKSNYMIVESLRGRRQ